MQNLTQAIWMQELMGLIIVSLLGIIAYFLRDLHTEIKRQGLRQEAINERLVRLEESGKADWRTVLRELEAFELRLSRLEQTTPPIGIKPNLGIKKGRTPRMEIQA